MDLCRLSLLLQTAGIIVLIHMIPAATAFEKQGSGPNWNWSLCDSSASYAVDINSIQVTPEVIARNEPLTIVSSLVTNQTIVSGAVIDAAATKSMGVISFHKDEQVNLCDMDQRGYSTDLACPVPAGPFNVTYKTVVDSEIPPGSYVVKANLYNNNQNLLVCIDIAFTLHN